MFGSMTANVFAQETGKYGNDVTWTLDDNGVLTVSGSGAIKGYTFVTEAPTYGLQGKIKKIIIEDGITSIGSNAFFMAGNVEEITIPGSLKELDECTFARTDADVVYYNAESCVFSGESTGLAEYYFPGCKKLVIGKGVKKIGENVFLNAISPAEAVVYEGSAEDWEKIDINYTGNEVLHNVILNAPQNDTENDAITDTKIKILINNHFLECDQPPVIKDNRTLVPMRAIFEALGAEVSWDESTKTATGTKDGKEVSVSVSENSISINGEKKEIDVPAQIIGDRTMVPVRAISEAFDCSVQWNGLKKCVIIIPKNQTPYKIDVLTNGEIIATAHFNESGLLTKITHDTDKSLEAKCAFLPLYLNMNGNAYFNIFWNAVFYQSTGVIDFAYENDRLASVAYEDKTLTYSYNEDNTVKNIVSSFGTDKSFNYSMYPIVKCGEEIYTFNDDGLLSETDMHQSGGQNSFSYNNYNLSRYLSYYGMTYNYDGQRLTKASHREGGVVTTDFVYQYSNE